MNILWYLSFFVVICIVVLVHEAGHFVAGILVKARIFEFNIGMGPKLKSIKKREIEYNIRAFPIGGSVNFGATYDSVGENDYAYVMDSSDPRALENKSILQRIFVFVSGPLMNFVLAIVVFFGLFTYYGTPLPTGAVMINEVVESSPAESAGLMLGDLIKSVDGVEVYATEDVSNLVNQNLQDTHEILVIRNSQEILISVTKLYYDEELSRFRIGIGLSTTEFKKGILYAIPGAFRYTWAQISGTIKAIGKAFSGAEKLELSGPVGIAEASSNAAKSGLGAFLQLIAIISISLGLINLFPIPILDGGWILLLIIQAFRGKPLSQKVEYGLKLAGLVLILVLFVYATYSDILRIFTSAN